MSKRQIGMKKSVLTAAALAAAMTACAEPPVIEKPRSQMSQRERDSTIAASGLPGSGVVKKGMNMADREAKRAAMLDSLGSEN